MIRYDILYRESEPTPSNRPIRMLSRFREKYERQFVKNTLDAEPASMGQWS